jgi:hypothetical protein
LALNSIKANTSIWAVIRSTSASLRCANKKHVKDDTRLPLSIFKNDSLFPMSSRNSGKLLHLVMEGGCLTDEDLGDTVSVRPC